MPIEDYFEEWDVDSLIEGEIIRARGFKQIEEDERPLKVEHMRKLIKELANLYYTGKPPSKKEFNEIFEKNEKEMMDDLFNTYDQLEKSEDFFKVDKKEIAKDGSITIKLKKVDKEDRIKVIRSIAKKLVEKLTEPQLISMLEEGIRKNNSFEELKEIDEDLDKEDVKVSDKKGCFKLIVNGKDIMILR